MEQCGNSIKRKCICGKPIVITRQNVDSIIYINKKYYHSECFTNMCKGKLNNTKAKKEKWLELLENIDEIKADSRKALQNLLDKDAVCKYIIETYEISIIPTVVFHKLAAIYSGSYKGMAVSIPPSQLLDMWKRKMPYLEKVFNRNKSIGKEFDKAQRINYDLSILINKYDSYLEWREKQKLLESKCRNAGQDILKGVDLYSLNKNPRQAEAIDDIDQLLDELF